jgi:hypothetical protein
MKKKGNRMVPNCVPKEGVEEGTPHVDENLNKWFKDKWVRFGPDGKIRGDCAREDDTEGKPKCLPQSKAHSLGKEGRASAAARKRREDPNPERRGAPINVATEEVEQIDEKNVPTSPEKWARAKAAAKSKFAVYPSAYANGWASKKYKSMGGGWRATSEEVMSAAPTNAVGTGNIAGSGGAGGEPGVSKKRNPLMSFYKRKPPKM